MPARAPPRAATRRGRRDCCLPSSFTLRASNTSFSTAQEYGVNGYPTIKLFGEDKRRPLEYNGGRDAESMAAFLLAKWAALQPPSEARRGPNGPS